MVFTNKYTQDLIKRFPKFFNSISFKDTIELYSDGTGMVTPHTIFSALTNYVVDEIIYKNINVTREEIEILNYIEDMRVKFSSFHENTDEGEFDEAICVCFLENLINIASADKIKYDRFIPYLGEKSKEYCRAWDEFTRVKSPGLWEDCWSKNSQEERIKNRP